MEAGLYNSYGPTLLQLTGTALGPSATAPPAPYARVAYEWNWAGQSAHVGALLLHASLNPAISERSATGAVGTDGYTDFAIDGGYQFLGTARHIFTGRRDRDA